MRAGEVLYGVGTLLLAFAFIYAMWRNATRNKANDKITEAATHEAREHPYEYEHGGREALKRQLKD